MRPGSLTPEDPALLRKFHAESTDAFASTRHLEVEAARGTLGDAYTAPTCRTIVEAPTRGDVVEVRRLEDQLAGLVWPVLALILGRKP